MRGFSPGMSRPFLVHCVSDGCGIRGGRCDRVVEEGRVYIGFQLHLPRETSVSDGPYLVCVFLIGLILYVCF